MHAEIVMIGSELLLGELVDTNANKLAIALRNIGLDLYYKNHRGGQRGPHYRCLKSRSGPFGCGDHVWRNRTNRRRCDASSRGKRDRAPASLQQSTRSGGRCTLPWVWAEDGGKQPTPSLSARRRDAAHEPRRHRSLFPERGRGRKRLHHLAPWCAARTSVHARKTRLSLC